MKILFLDQFSAMGGAQQVLLETVEAAQARGWRCSAAVPSDGPLIPRLRARRVEVATVPCGPYRAGKKSAANTIRFSLDALEQLRMVRRLCAEERFDLLYVNGPRLMPSVTLARQGASVLFHVHSRVLQASAAKLMEWSVQQSGATLVGCSHFVVAPFKGKLAPNKIHVIPNGVREVPFRNRRFPDATDWRIGMIGRISREKGQVEFVRAVEVLTSGLPQARFVICGAPLFGDDNYDKDVQKLAARLPVEFLGWREDISQVLADLDLLLVPSREEGLGRIILESFSAGVPVIAFPAGGIPEAVIDNETGFLTSEISAEALARRILQVLALSPDVLERVVSNARTRWERNYGLARYQERITAIMESLIPASSAAARIEKLPAHT